MEIHDNIEEQRGELRCPRCKRNDIVLSLPRGLRDMFMEGLGRAPRHCRSCGKRFYVKATIARDSEDSGQA